MERGIRWWVRSRGVPRAPFPSLLSEAVWRGVAVLSARFMDLDPSPYGLGEKGWEGCPRDPSRTDPRSGGSTSRTMVESHYGNAIRVVVPGYPIGTAGPRKQALAIGSRR